MTNRSAVTTILLLLLLPAVTSLSRAEEFHLTLKKIRLTKKNEGVLPEKELRPVRAFPGDAVTAEPSYRSKEVQRFLARFGEKGREITVAFAVDEKRGTGKGFDLLCADTAGRGNLKKGKKLSGKPERRSYSYTDTRFPPFTVSVPSGAGGDPLALPVRVRFSARRDLPSDSSIYLTPLAVMQGKVRLGARDRTLVVFDADCNGVFGEPARLRRSTAEGDRIWIGKGNPPVEQAFMESLPLGRYYLFEGAYYTLSFSEGGTRVAVEKAEVPLGTLRLKNPGFLLELAGKEGVLYVQAEKEMQQEVPVPAGEYTLNRADFRRRYKGALWELQGKAGTFRTRFEVKKDAVTEIEVGPPLRVVIRSRTRRAGNGLLASLSFTIGGSKGETYRYLLRNGKKVDLPEVVIKSPGGKVVRKGRFEYG